ncbi:MAG: hypothetical protein R6U27_00690 [Desulfobacterales bacterium]
MSVKNTLRRRMLEILKQDEIQNLEQDIEDKRQSLVKANTLLTLIVNGIIRAMSKTARYRKNFSPL